MNQILQDFILKLLQKDPDKRLGTKHDAADLKSHPFFNCINWKDLENKKIPAPFKPRILDELDTTNFSDEFTSQDPIDVEVEAPKNSANLFRNFSYVSPQLIELERKARQTEQASEEAEKVVKSKYIHRPVLEDILEMKDKVEIFIIDILLSRD